MTDESSSRRRRRLWRFGPAALDEASWTLRVSGQPVPMEAKPLALLHELLLHAGEVVTKDELLDSVWSGVTVVEGSLATAVSKLRRALGDSDGQIIETVPRIGYRLTGEVTIDSIDAPLAPRFAFVAGDSVPGRKQWLLQAPLGSTGAADVWRATHAKTGEVRVFKFADTPDRLRALKREAALARLIGSALGADAPIVRLYEWNFEAAPYFLELSWGGEDLLHLDAAALDRDARIALAAAVCRAVDAVHRIGVLHKDLKPANILIGSEEGDRHVRLVDFGSGRVLDGALLRAFNVTDPGSLDTGDGGSEQSGTYAYRAPELVRDAPSTVASDVYALGLIVFQLVAGDWSVTLSPGWEAVIGDPLLVDDIARASAGDPADRLASAGALAERLETLGQRRAAAEQVAEAAARAEALARNEERRRLRRPWIRAAAAALVVALLSTSGFAVFATIQRNQAIAARHAAEASYAFLAEDVLAQPDPARSTADESVMAAVKRAAAGIDKRFADRPDIAARLYLAMAHAFNQRGDNLTAGKAYDHADALFIMAGQSTSDEAVLGRLQHAQMDELSGDPQATARADAVIVRESRALGAREKSGRVGFQLAITQGTAAYMTDAPRAETAFRRALAIARTPGAAPSLSAVLKAGTSLALTLMRQGKAVEAEPIMRRIVARSTIAFGPDYPDTLLARQNLLNAQSLQGKPGLVVAGATQLMPLLIRRFGPNHRYTLALHSTRFEGLSALGRYREAAADAKAVWQGASTASGPDSHQALVGETDYASALCQAGNTDTGVVTANDALSRVRAAFGPDYPLTHTVAYFAAECLIAANRHGEARPLLLSVDRAKVGGLIGDAHWGGQLDAALAEIALKGGDRAGAAQLLAAAQEAAVDDDDPNLHHSIDDLARQLNQA